MSVRSVAAVMTMARPLAPLESHRSLRAIFAIPHKKYTGRSNALDHDVQRTTVRSTTWMSTVGSKGAQPRRDVFTQFPATGPDSLIVRYAFAGDDRLAYSFAATADRLVSTFTGSPSDDAMLLPYLYLYRHAMELELKQAIRYAARLRRARGDEDAGLAPDVLNEDLKVRIGHRLMALVEALDLHLQALDLERTPKSVRQTLQLISNADKMGVAFRYSGSLPDTQDNINFGALASAVQGAYELLAAAQDVLAAFEDALRDFQGYEDEMRQDFEDEMRREYEGY